MNNRQLAVQLLEKVPEDNLTQVISFLEKMNFNIAKKEKSDYQKVIDDLYGCCAPCNDSLEDLREERLKKYEITS